MTNKKKDIIAYFVGVSVMLSIIIINKIYEYVEYTYPSKNVYVYTPGKNAQRYILSMEKYSYEHKDTSSFVSLTTYYIYTPRYQMQEELTVAMVSANKLDFGDAYELTSTRLLYWGNTTDLTDSLTSKIGLSYLKAAASHSSMNAIKELREGHIYNKYVNKDCSGK